MFHPHFRVETKKLNLLQNHGGADGRPLIFAAFQGQWVAVIAAPKQVEIQRKLGANDGLRARKHDAGARCAMIENRAVRIVCSASKTQCDAITRRRLMNNICADAQRFCCLINIVSRQILGPSA